MFGFSKHRKYYASYHWAVTKFDPYQIIAGFGCGVFFVPRRARGQKVWESLESGVEFAIRNHLIVNCLVEERDGKPEIAILWFCRV